jgi:hypothetical protein
MIPRSIAFESNHHEERPSELSIDDDNVLYTAKVKEFPGESLEGLERRIRDLHRLLAKAKTTNVSCDTPIYTVITPSKSGSEFGCGRNYFSTISAKSERTEVTVDTYGSTSVYASEAETDEHSINSWQEERSSLTRNKASVRLDLEPITETKTTSPATLTTDDRACDWGYFVDAVDEPARKPPQYRNFLKMEIERAPVAVTLSRFGGY